MLSRRLCHAPAAQAARRGPILDEFANHALPPLARAFESGRVGGYEAGVLERERVPPEGVGASVQVTTVSKGEDAGPLCHDACHCP